MYAFILRILIVNVIPNVLSAKLQYILIYLYFTNSVTRPSYRIHGGVESRANMYRERLQLTLQRMLRGSFVMKGISNKKELAADTYEVILIQIIMYMPRMSLIILTSRYQRSRRCLDPPTTECSWA